MEQVLKLGPRNADAKFDFLFHIEKDLQYEVKDRASSRDGDDERRCQMWSCGKTGVPLKFCAACQTVAYCSRACQRTDWKASHKRHCKKLKALNEGKIDKQDTVKRLLHKVRVWICPFAVQKRLDMGPGFLSIKLDCTLKDCVFDQPVDFHGRPLNRSAMVEYMTVSEWADSSQDDFEKLVFWTREQLLESMMKKRSHCILFSCGYLCSSIPRSGYGICCGLELTTRYGKLQLNIDT